MFPRIPDDRERRPGQDLSKGPAGFATRPVDEVLRARMAVMTTSKIYDPFAVASRPDVASLAGGMTSGSSSERWDLLETFGP